MPRWDGKDSDLIISSVSAMLSVDSTAVHFIGTLHVDPAIIIL